MSLDPQAIIRDRRPMPIQIDRPLGDVLRSLREDAGLTKREVARRIVGADGANLANVERYVERWERGARVPTVEDLRMVLDALGFELEIRRKSKRSSKSTDPEK